ncbi:MAG: hypothetical protein QOG16_1278 [Actinomycetota bacterium]|nr:hypothetical protein [Actinomycetota bacterium]
MLNAHPEVAVPSESRFVVEFWEGRDEVDADVFLKKLAAHHLFAQWQIPIDSVRAEIGNARTCRYAEAVAAAYQAFARAHGKVRWGDKTPRYVEHIPLLVELFPDARFVHLLRDGRDVALSYANVPFGPKTVARAAQLWAARVEAGIRDGRALPPGRYLELMYEDLIEDSEGEIKTLCDFLDLEFDAGMLDHGERASGVILDRARKFNPLITQKPVARTSNWTTSMKPSHVEVFEAVAGHALVALGYERRFPRPSASARLRGRLGAMGLPVGRIDRKKPDQ